MLVKLNIKAEDFAFRLRISRMWCPTTQPHGYAFLPPLEEDRLVEKARVYEVTSKWNIFSLRKLYPYTYVIIDGSEVFYNDTVKSG